MERYFSQSNRRESRTTTLFQIFFSISPLLLLFDRFSRNRDSVYTLLNMYNNTHLLSRQCMRVVRITHGFSLLCGVAYTRTVWLVTYTNGSTLAPRADY